jgi:hypothetical protein
MKNNIYTIWERAKAWLAEVLASSHVKSPVANEADFKKALAYINIRRLKIIAWLLIIFNLILIYTQLTYLDQVNIARAHEVAPYILILRMIFIVSSLAFLIAFRQPASPETLKPSCHCWIIGFVLMNLIGFAVLSCLIYSVLQFQKINR